MVRRWSYLNTKINNTFDVDSRSLGASFENHTFKVFKKTTFFRKYNRGLTSFVRRKNIFRKRKTNNIVLSYITANWVLTYLRLRRVCRYAQSKYTFRIVKSLSSIEAFRSKAKVFGFASGAFMTSLPKKMNKMNLTPKDSNARNTVIYSPYELDSQDLPISGLLLNSYLCDTQYFYSLKKFNSSDVINNMALVSYKQNVNIISSVRSITVLCTLLNISK